MPRRPAGPPPTAYRRAISRLARRDHTVAELRRASNPDEFKLKIQGIQSTSDMAAEEMERTMQSFDLEQ